MIISYCNPYIWFLIFIIWPKKVALTISPSIAFIATESFKYIGTLIGNSYFDLSHLQNSIHALRTSGSIFLSHRCNKNLYYIHIYIYISPYISYKFNDFFINYQSRNLVFFISITISSVIFAFNSPAFLFFAFQQISISV